jgi:hypothetical protein
MARKTAYTKITPLPSSIPRQLALDMLHSHTEMIQLNPLVTGVRSIDAPRDAAADEFFAQWYEISEIITWGFGMKKKIAFKGVFHDIPNGLQTHVYAPMGVDMRNKWSVRGNQPGEPREPRELGVETPVEGLYLREDVEIVCNLALTSFVKKEQKAAAGVMVDRLTRKAELLDEGRLHAMFEDGKLKTVNPSIQGRDNMTLNHRDTMVKSPVPDSPGSPGTAPSIFSASSKYENYHDLVDRRSSRSQRMSTYAPSYQQPGYNGPESNNSHQAYGGASKSIPEAPIEMEGSYYHPQQQQNPQHQGQNPNLLNPNGMSFSAELADTSVPASPQPPTADSPGAQRPAPLNPHRNSNTVPSPQPSPALANRQSSSGSSPQIVHPAHRNSGSSHNRPYNPAEHQQAPTQPQSSPQLLQAEHRNSATSSQYAVTNPDRDEGFYSRNPSQRSANSAAEQQQQYQPQSSPYQQQAPYQNQGQGQPQQQKGLADMVRGLGIQDSARAGGADATQFGNHQGAVTKCPVCGNFEGDEQAVSFHVSKHFS